MRRRLLATGATAAMCAAAFVAPPSVPAQPATSVLGSSDDLTTLVNPLSGTLGAGFPMVSAALPFSLVQPGPDTTYPGAFDPFDYCGYAYEDPMIYGFSLTHFDGAGIHIGGDLPFMPTVGAVTTTDPRRYASPFSHAAETAAPGYYAVTLGSGTRAEVTATARAAMERFTFAPAKQANVLLDASQSLYGTHPASVTVVDDRTLQGSVSAPRNGGYTLYFTARFDRPFRAVGTWHGSTISAGSHSVSGGDAGAYVSFDASTDRAVTMRAGISYTDLAGSARNLDAEIPATASFASVRAAAHAAWNTRLHDVEATGGDPGVRATLMTNLYRSLLMPATLDDADGRYLGFDGAVHTVAPGHHHYTSLSLWDTYRSQTPLLALIEPGVTTDIGLSLLDDYDQNGQVIPRWTYANRDYGIMGGDSGSATLADITARGLLDATDSQRAWAALLHQATAMPPVWPRSHLDDYLANGYIGHDLDGNGTALTLEYAIDDAAALAVARRYGTAADVQMLTARARSWSNLVDPATRFLRPRNSDGSWANPTTAGSVQTWNPAFQDGYQEGTGWQYQWFAPQDIPGLAARIGGTAAAASRLDSFFSAAIDQPLLPAAAVAQEQASLFGIYYVGTQYTPANETDLWAPWYYDWLGRPARTQRIVRAEMGVYSTLPSGMPGNDDAGAMSAWYVLAAIGMYSVAPGGGVWALGSPAFDRVVVRPQGGAALLTILAPSASNARPYVASARLDGSPLKRAWLGWDEVVPGTTLAFTPSKLPTSWGAGSTPPALAG